MPRFFFDIRDRRVLHQDNEGDDLADFEAAREQAQAVLPDLARQDLPNGEFHTMSCEVRDDTGRIVYRAELTYRGTRLD